MSNAALQTAQRAAILEVEKLLQRSEDLKRLPALLQSYTTKRQARWPALMYCPSVQACWLTWHNSDTLQYSGTCIRKSCNHRWNFPSLYQLPFTIGRHSSFFKQLWVYILCQSDFSKSMMQILIISLTLGGPQLADIKSFSCHAKSSWLPLKETPQDSNYV